MVVKMYGGIAGNATNQMCGATSLIINGCANYGIIKSEHSLAGILGAQSSGVDCIIKNCYNVGDINVKRNTAGILATNNGIIKNCYNIGECSNNSDDMKYVLAYKNTGIVTDSYYLNEKLEDGTIIDENFMKTQEFVNMLNIDTESKENTGAYVIDTMGINNGYPILKGLLELYK